MIGEKAEVSSSDDLRTSGAGDETETAFFGEMAGRSGMDTWGGGTGEMRIWETVPGPPGGDMMGDRGGVAAVGRSSGAERRQCMGRKAEMGEAERGN